MYDASIVGVIFVAWLAGTRLPTAVTRTPGSVGRVVALAIAHLFVTDKSTIVAPHPHQDNHTSRRVTFHVGCESGVVPNVADIVRR